MSIEIWFVRHGHTAGNRSFYICGRTDESLDLLGLQQAERCREKLYGHRFDAVYCSPLMRTKQTAMLATKDIIAPEIIYDERLMERDYGPYEKKWGPLKMFKLWHYGHGYVRSKHGEEPLLSMEMRVSDFIEEIKAKHDGQKVLIISHSGVATMFDTILESRQRKGWFFKNFHMPNGGIVIFSTKSPTPV